MRTHRLHILFLLNILAILTLILVNKGCGGGGGGGGTTTGVAPVPPYGVTATAGDGQVTISWTAVSEATSYNIYWSTTSGVTKTTGTKISNVTSPYVHTSLSHGTTYYYVVTAANSYGESSELIEVSAMPFAIPAVPAGVTASAGAGDGQVALSWNSVSGAVSYNIYWSTTSGVTKGTGTKISVGPISSYTHSGLNNGTTYYYVVTTVNIYGAESAESTEVSASPQAGATAPLTNAATNITDTTATLNGSFNNPSGYTTTVWFDYGTTTVYGNSTASQNYATAGTVNVSVNITGLQQTTTYHYRVVTQNTGGTFYGSDKTFTTYITPQVVASGLDGPVDMAVDSTSVYWTEAYYSGIPGGGAVRKVGINGDAVTNLATALYSPYSIAIDSTSVYWIGWDGGDVIKKVGISGGTVTTIASGLNSPYSIAVDSTSVYWAEIGSGTGTMTGAVKKVGINGGSVETLVSGLDMPWKIVVDSSSVYWADNSDGGWAIKKVGINGGTVIILASGIGQPSDIAVDSASVYWASSNGINKIGINGGTVTSLTTAVYSPFSITIDSTNVYWTNTGSGTGSINKVGINGGTVTTLAYGLNSPSSIAVDSTSVYWIDAGTYGYILGAIKKVPKSY